MATDFDDAAKTLRAWAKAYRDGPTEHRFPSDPHAEFFPGDMDAGAAEIERLNHECQASMATIARERARAEKAEAESERLRAALKEIERMLWPTANSEHPSAVVRYAAWKTAQAALGNEQSTRGDHG